MSKFQFMIGNLKNAATRVLEAKDFAEKVLGDARPIRNVDTGPGNLSIRGMIDSLEHDIAQLEVMSETFEYMAKQMARAEQDQKSGVTESDTMLNLLARLK